MALSNCSVLEDLLVDGFRDVGKLIVTVPSLQRLSLQITDALEEFEIDTPSLKYLRLDYEYEYEQLYTLTYMPKLKEAFVDVSFTFFAKLIGLIPSVKRLSLCLSFHNISEVVFDDGFVFNKLKHLKLCTCKDDSSNVLVQLLKVSPNLRELELFRMEGHGGYMEYWNQPSSIPECISSSLKTFKWSRFHGTKDERELVIYILQNGHRLKTATIHFYQYSLLRIFDIKKELELSSRASTTCQLLFH